MPGSRSTVTTGHASGTLPPPPGPGGLPPGVSLQAIDGGPAYYGNNGFTYAANAGWDSPSFFPIGVWYGQILDQTAANRWLDLGLNTLFRTTSDTDLSIVRSNGLYAVVACDITPGTPETPGSGSETVGLMAIDEPGAFSQIQNVIQATPNSLQDGRWWWLNNTYNFIAFGGLAPTDQEDVLDTPIVTPNGSTRHVDVQSVDLYWFAGAQDNVPFQGGELYSLPGDMPIAEVKCGARYGDMVDLLRPYQAGHFPAPILQFVEDGGPLGEDRIVGNTTIASGSNGGSIASVASWSSPSPGVLSVASTAAFLSGGTAFPGPLFVACSGGVAELNYTGISGNTFTGCSYVAGAAGTVSTGGLVYQSDYITPREMNAGVWGSIIHGALMICYFNHTFAGPAQDNDNFAQPYYQTAQPGQNLSIYAQAKATNALVKLLAPVIRDHTALGYLTITPAPALFPSSSGVEAMVKYHNGQWWIFAAYRGTETDTNISVTFTTADSFSGTVHATNADGDTATYGSSYTLTATNGVFTDTLAGGWSVRIYRIG